MVASTLLTAPLSEKDTLISEELFLFRLSNRLNSFNFVSILVNASGKSPIYFAYKGGSARAHHKCVHLALVEHECLWFEKKRYTVLRTRYVNKRRT